jgi:hypothetical protein
MEFFTNMEPLLQAFWYIALPATLIFLIQSIMTFAGMDAHDGADADFNSDLSGTDTPFQLFSLRNLINFLMGFGWAGITCYNTFENKLIVTAIALLVGIGFVALFFVIIRQIQKLAEDNSFKVENALNKTCTVYLSIPAGKTGRGKIQISVNGSFQEIEAMTEGEKIETGSTVRVVKTEGNNLVFVEKI